MKQIIAEGSEDGLTCAHYVTEETEVCPSHPTCAGEDELCKAYEQSFTLFKCSFNYKARSLHALLFQTKRPSLKFTAKQRLSF